jgi:hypothetical protein
VTDDFVFAARCLRICERASRKTIGWVRLAVQGNPLGDLDKQEEKLVPVVIDRYGKQWYADDFVQLPDVTERVYASEDEAVQAGYEKAKRAQVEGDSPRAGEDHGTLTSPSALSEARAPREPR